VIYVKTNAPRAGAPRIARCVIPNMSMSVSGVIAAQLKVGN
jgi:hypothetical protein